MHECTHLATLASMPVPRPVTEPVAPWRRSVIVGRRTTIQRVPCTIIIILYHRPKGVCFILHRFWSNQNVFFELYSTGPVRCAEIV